MDETVGRGVVVIEADAKGLGRDIDRQVDAQGNDIEGSGKSVGSKWGTAFKAGALVAVAAVGAFAASSVGAASDLAESANAVNVTFGDAAGGITALGKDAATAVGLSASEFNGLAVRFGSFASTISGDGGDVVGTMDEMTTRAADFASVMNLDVGDAAQIFQSGLAGESEPLRQYGIDLSAAAVEAFAVANGISESGAAMTEAQKVQARYGLLMQETSQTAGDFANTSDGLANQQRIMAAEFENVKAKIGSALIPIFTKVVSFITKTVIPGFVTVKNAIAGAFEWINDNKAILIAAFTGVAVAVGVVLVPAFIAWAATAGAAAIATLTAAAPVIALGVAVAALAAGIVWLYQNVDWFRAAVNAVRDFIMDKLVPAFQAIWGFIDDKVIPVLKKVIEVYLLPLKLAFEGIKWVITEVLIPAFQAVWGFISDKVIPVISTLVETYIKVLVAAFQGLKAIITDVVIPAFQAVWAFIRDNIIPIYAAIASTVIEVGGTVGRVIGEIVGFVVGIPGKIGGVLSGLWTPIQTGITAAKDWVSDKIDDVVGFATKLPGRMAGLFTGMWDGIKDAFRAAINFVIRGWNSLRFKMPSIDTHIPGIGEVGGFEVGVPPITPLARGGVIDVPTIAMLGEYSGVRRNPEVVAPADLLAEIFQDALASDRTGPPIVINNLGQTFTPAVLSAGLAMARMAR